MKRIRALTVLLWLQAAAGFAPHAAAQRRPQELRGSPPHVVERLSASLEVRIGASSAPYFTRNLPEVRGHGIVGLVRGGYRLDERHSLGVEAPLLAISLRQPAGSYLDEFSWGNLLLFYQHDRALLDAPPLRLTVHTGVSLALPIAEQSGSASLGAGRALRLGSALDGFRHPELYTEGVVPVTTNVGATLARGRFAAVAGVRLPLLLRFSEAELPKDARPRPLGVTTVLHLGVSAEATRWLHVSLAADTAVDAVRAVEPARAAARVQLSLAPALTFRLPRGVRLGTTFVLPIAGALGGSSYAGSFVLGYRR